VLYLAPLHKGLLTEGTASHFRVFGTAGRHVSGLLEVPAASHSGERATYASWIEGCEVSRSDLESSVKTTT
jgi:hypothetical protein